MPRASLAQVPLALLAAVLLVLPLSAQPTLVTDIKPGSSGSVPRYLTAFEGAVYFRADDGTNGFELWKSDGTSAGTALVKDILPGANSSLNVGTAFDTYFAVFDGALYFRATDGTTGSELWRTDGTTDGTVRVADIAPGPNGSNPSMFTPFDGALYFSASDGTNGTELWKTDGTAAGTVLVKDVWPGAPGGVRSIPEFTPFGGALYFSADDGTNGLELWRTDGTTAGTVLVKDIRPGAPDGLRNDIASEYTVFDGALYFVAWDGTTGRELWRTDGTEAGTELVADLYPGPEASAPTDLTVFDGRLYFAAEGDGDDRELWSTDGTAAGTVLVKDIHPGPEASEPAQLTVFDGALYFLADDGTSGLEVWRSDGTAAGTVLVEDINPGSAGITSAPMAVFDGALYFAANDGTNGREMWRTDGTEAGTMLVADINPGTGAGCCFELTPTSGALYFQANDGTNGQELWVLVGSGTPAESGPDRSGLALTVAPNPTSGQAALTLTLSGSVREARVVAYDVLGRQVAVLHDGPLGAGPHRLAFDVGAPGAYVVRARTRAEAVSRTLTVVR